VEVTLPEIVDEARRVLERAEAEDVTLRLLGGVAVFLRSPNGLAEPLRRAYQDLDFATSRASAKGCAGLLNELGYEPHVPFNSLHGSERLLFFDDRHGRKADVFVGRFRMSHEIPLEDRLALEPLTVPLAELLLTKLQIAELNEKDVRDSIALLHEHRVGDEDGDAVNAARVAELLSDDWGLWRTITGNLAVCRDHLGRYGLPEEDTRLVAERIDALTARIESEPKSRGWRLRARIGERKRWYETPEEVDWENS
jgi:hypothetical protein